MQQEVMLKPARANERAAQQEAAHCQKEVVHQEVAV